MNKVFKITIVILFLIFNFYSSGTKLEVENIVLSNIHTSNLNDYVIKENTYNVFKLFNECIDYEQRFLGANFSELRKMLREKLANKLNEALPKEFKDTLSSLLLKTLDENPTLDQNTQLIESIEILLMDKIKEELITIDILGVKGLIDKLIMKEDINELDKSEQVLRECSVKLLVNELKTSDRRKGLSDLIKKELEKFSLNPKTGEIEDIGKLSKELIGELIKISDVVINYDKKDDTYAKAIRKSAVLKLSQEFIKELGGDLINDKNVRLVNQSIQHLSQELSSGLNWLRCNELISNLLSRVNKNKNIEVEVMHVLLIKVLEELLCEPNKNYDLIKEYYRPVQELLPQKSEITQKFLKELDAKIIEFQKALEEDFDINATFKNNEKLIIKAISKITPYQYSYSSYGSTLYGLLGFPNIQILYFLLDKKELDIDIRILEKIFDIIIKAYKIDELYDNELDNYNIKFLGYAKRFINNSHNFVRLSHAIYSSYREFYTVIEKLDLFIKEKEDNFFSSIIKSINGSKLKDLKNLLKPLDKEYTDLFYKKNEKMLIDCYAADFYNKLSYYYDNGKRIQIRHDYPFLIKAISYLKHNNLELAIGNILKDMFAKSYNSKSLKDKNLEEYNLMRLIIENASMDELLACFPKVDYVPIAMNHLIKDSKNDITDTLKEELSQKAFLVAYPEYNPITIAYNANNYKMLSGLIHNTDLLLNADVWGFNNNEYSELEKLVKLYKNTNATKDEILSFDMSVVNFKNLFAGSVNTGKFDISCALLEEFLHNIDKYSLSDNTGKLSGSGKVLMEIYTEELFKVINPYIDEFRKISFQEERKEISKKLNAIKEKFKILETKDSYEGLQEVCSALEIECNNLKEWFYHLYLYHLYDIDKKSKDILNVLKNIGESIGIRFRQLDSFQVFLKYVFYRIYMNNQNIHIIDDGIINRSDSEIVMLLDNINKKLFV